MAGIRSINEPRAPLQPDINVPPIVTQAVGDPPKPTTTFLTPEKIIGLMIYGDRLYVATEGGVYEQGRDGIFRRLKFEIVEEPTE